MRISSRSAIALVLLTTQLTLFSDRLFCNAQEHSSSNDEYEQQQQQQQQQQHEHEQQLYQEEQRRQRQQYYHEQQMQQERIQQEQRQKYLDQVQQEQEQQQQQQQHVDAAQDQQREQGGASQEYVEELKINQEEIPIEEGVVQIDESQQSPDNPDVDQRRVEETIDNAHADERTQDEHADLEQENEAGESIHEGNTHSEHQPEQDTIPGEEERIDRNAGEENVAQQQNQHMEEAQQQQQQQQHDMHQDHDPNGERQHHEPEHQQPTPQMEQEVTSGIGGVDQPQTETHDATGGNTDDKTASNTQEMDMEVADEATPVEEQDELYVSDDEPLSTPQSERKPARSGSLKQFVDKVKDYEQNLSGETPERQDQEAPPKQQHPPPEDQTTASHQTPPQAQTTPPQKPNDLTNLEEVAPGDNANQVWGSAGNKRYADLEILGQLFHKDMVDNPDGRYNKVFEPVVDLVIPSLYADIMGEDATEKAGETVLIVDDENEATLLQGISGKRSVNSEFVEGLDDIDKLFEDVDPPDEFDVGASGTSIQDVLMGQTIKIIIKRVKIGAHYTSRGFKALKSRITIYLAKKDRKFSMPKVDKEHLVRARQWSVTHGKLLVVKSKELFESFFGEDGDELVGDEFDELQKKLKDMTGAP